MQSSAAKHQLHSLVISHRSGRLSLTELAPFLDELEAYVELEQERFRRHGAQFEDVETTAEFTRLVETLQGFRELSQALRNSQDWDGQAWHELLREAAELDAALAASYAVLQD